MASEIKKRSVLIASGDAALECQTADGEVLFRVPVPVGRHDAAAFIQFGPPDSVWEPVGEIVVFQPPGAVGIHDAPGRVQSGANPHFRPTPQGRFEKEMRHQLALMQAKSDRAERRSAAAAKVPRVPRPKPDAVPVADEPVVEE